MIEMKSHRGYHHLVIIASYTFPTTQYSITMPFMKGIRRRISQGTRRRRHFLRRAEEHERKANEEVLPTPPRRRSAIDDGTGDVKYTSSIVHKPPNIVAIHALPDGRVSPISVADTSFSAPDNTWNQKLEVAVLLVRQGQLGTHHRVVLEKRKQSLITLPKNFQTRNKTVSITCQQSNKIL